MVRDTDADTTQLYAYSLPHACLGELIVLLSRVRTLESTNPGKLSKTTKPGSDCNLLSFTFGLFTFNCWGKVVPAPHKLVYMTDRIRNNVRLFSLIDLIVVN